MADYYSDSDQIVDAAIKYAKDQLNKPYRVPASPPNSWDCSTLTTWCYQKASGGRINLTPYSKTQAQEVKKFNATVGQEGQFQPGDLLFFFENGTHHVSLYIGGEQIIEASSPEVGVRQTNVWNSWNSNNFSWAGRPYKIGPYGGSDSPNSTTSDSDDDARTAIEKKSVRKVKKDALAISRVVGTPQTGRFAVMNVANESIFLTQDNSSAITKTQFSLSARVINPGDKRELSISIPGGDNGYQITLETDLIQGEDQANSTASLISRYLDVDVDSIEINLFGNPLLEIGDIVKFNYNNKNIVSSSDQYYIITRISQNFSDGLSTTITIKPLIQTVSVL